MLVQALDFILDSDTRAKYMKILRRLGKTDGLEKTLRAYDIDAIIGPAESSLTELCAAAGTFRPFSLRKPV